MRHTTAERAARVPSCILVVALAVSGCGQSATDKAGGERDAVATVLRMANGNGDNAELVPFARAVARRSGGTLRIAFENGAEAGEPDYEQRIIARVRKGTSELGWVGSRALDDAGVTSFDALHAPLLIDSYALEREVLRGALAKGMLGGLDRAGVVGLGILPGPLRKPIGVKALVRPADFRGKTIAGQRSQIAAQTLRALGARLAAIPSGAAISGYDGVEQQIGSAAGNLYDRVAGVVTANVNLWPRPAVLFANPDALERLTAAQQRALRGAAQEAFAATLAGVRAAQSEGLGGVCRRNATLVTATPADLGALRRAVQPVYDRLERDARTKAAIAAIRAVRSKVGSPPDAPVCPRDGQPITPASANAIDGTYHSDITLDELRRTPGYDPGENHPGNVGRFRMQLREGRFRITGSSDGVDQEGTFSLKGDRLTFAWNDEGSFSYRWSLYRGTLTLHKTGAGPTFFAVHPWREVDMEPTPAPRTPIDGVYRVTTTARGLRAAGSPDVVSENYGEWRYVFDRGKLRYTQSSEGASRWTEATYTVKGQTLTFTVTDFGGEAPNGAAEKTGETFTFRWSLFRDRLTLSPVKGRISPENFRVKPWRRVGDVP